MRSGILLLFVLSVGFAQLIDYDYSHSTGKLYQIEQQDPDYYTSNTLVYHLETQLSVPPANWLSGSGSYSDVHDGDYICAGPANYVTRVNARISGFSGYIPSYSGADEDPGDWPNCGEPTSCPTPGTQYVRWSESIYNSYKDDTILDGQHLGSDYFRRSISYRESGIGSPFTNEVAESMTVMKGTASLMGGYSLIAPIYSFGSLSGTEPSHSGTVNLNSGGDYTFIQRLDVAGAVIGAYNPNVGREDYRAFKDLCTNPPSCNSQNEEYSVSNIHDSAVVHVVENSDIGVIPPTIQSVTLQGHTMTDGHYILEPGEDIPTTIRVRIPPRTSEYSYYLSFELDEASASEPFSYTATSGLGQCGQMFPLINGGWLLGNPTTYVNITGTLHVPDALPQEGGNIQFTVHWRTCSGEVDCSGNGDSGWATPFEVPYIPPGENGPYPDLACSIEPVAILGANASATELTEGQGVEQWRVTITNVGDGDLTLTGNSSSQLAQYLCLQGLFNAYEQDSFGSETWAYDPGLLFYLLSTSNLDLLSGESITKILNGPAYCREGEGEIGALAIINTASLFYSQCATYEIPDEDWGNNVCTWSIPCTNETVPEIPGDENCTIHPSSYLGAVGGEYDFTLECGGGECSGAVSWDISGGGSIFGNQTGATATVLSDSSDLLITATVDNPDGEDAVCYAEIYFGGEANGNGCHISPTPQAGYPGSEHWFDLTCSGEGIEDGDCPNAEWSISKGAAFVKDSYGDLFHWEGALDQFAVNTTIIVEAEVDFPSGAETCQGEIIVPEIPCIDYV
ncbi:MAG: hypothetical protein QXH30_00345 [Candidatus Bilamarchaeaceae archaeon]